MDHAVRHLLARCMYHSRHLSIRAVPVAHFSKCSASFHSPRSDSRCYQPCATDLSHLLAQAHITPLQSTPPSRLEFSAAGGQNRNLEYRLPTLSENTLQKRTILDPLLNPQEYVLPTIQLPVKEIVAPPLENIVPVEDPSPLQSIIDQGAPPLVKECMPYLMRIRHKKMKKHKLKKLRKRMIFYNRKLTEVKKKKKEKILVAYEKQFAKIGQDFVAEEFVNEQINLARAGGWKVDIFETQKSK